MPSTKKKDIIYPHLSYELNGLFFKVHNNLGRYRNEQQYADAFEKVLKDNKIQYNREKRLPPSFNGERVGRNIPDFIIKDTILVDFKAKRLITKNDYYQMQRYLVSYKKKLGILVNFRHKSLTPKRVINPEL